MNFELISDGDAKASKKIYILSDGTGQSAINILRACLIQFDDSQVRVSVYSKMDSEEKIRNILSKVSREDCFVAFTMAKKSLRQTVHEICHTNGISHHDILGPPVDKLQKFLKKTPKENPNLLRRVDSKYFKRIEAVEFCISHDDGKSLKGIHEADIVLLGLSRTSKTPTSFFLGQQGYKVINIPIVPEVDLPKEVFEVDQNKVVCLIMEPEVLQKVRLARLKHYKTTSRYTDLRKIFEEVEMVYDLVARNRNWHVVDTTNKSVEETAREIIIKVYGRELEI
ncbi:MAG: [pyruvate, water dikinase]-phosphate phosphotransferase / [pyruvate, water dikinase] kinase [Deferribacteres bacterium]|jgi:regulator of PEP synthase PpsR (kinase-PPPase family)|nr:[pyruvate, water dikinase]-phosphate phosphotransferase / [pyruvate, water dikinase] kinase [Deferribacteres bacterium]